MQTYAIQHTQRGRYLVRGMMNREIGQYDAEADAQAEIARLMARDATRSAAMSERVTSAREFDAMVPGLNARQVAFQAAMHRGYDHLAWEARNLTGRASHLANLPDSPSLGYRSAQHQDDAERHAENYAIYDQAGALLRRMAVARQNRDVDALTAAMDEAEAMLPTLESIR